jgi:two-component system, cell cycle response regulator DivK
MTQSYALIIDDDTKNVSVLVRLLAREGLSSMQVNDPTKLDVPAEVRDKLRVVFVDMEMPGLNGYQVLEKLRGDADFQTVPMIAYTVHISEINSAHRAGFDGFLGKPLDSEKFSDQLARILNSEPVWETV